jgi:hypothetical protein
MSDKISLDPFDPRFLMRPPSWPQVVLPPINLYNAPKQQFDPKVANKFDGGKTRFELVDPLALKGLADVLEFGAKKYAVDNWRKGFPFTRIIASLERHLNAIKAGEDVDPESGLPHIDHVGCNWMFLSFFMKKMPELDDRWYSQQAARAVFEKMKDVDAPRDEWRD